MRKRSFDELAVALEEKSIPEPNTGCILWTEGSQRGYGIITYGGKTWGAHRLSYFVHRGEIPAGLHVCHKCDTPACININHLFLGTMAENMNDKIAKGRQSKPPLREFCINGHKRTTDNLYIYKTPTGKTARLCIKCSITRNMKRYWALKAQERVEGAELSEAS